MDEIELPQSEVWSAAKATQEDDSAFLVIAHR